MKIRTNAPSVLDSVFRILSSNGINCTKKTNNEADISSTNEGEIRLLLQQKLDEAKFDYANDYVLLDGNTIWSYDKVSKELSKIKKKGSTEGISKYFYNFMHLNFTGAHYNINGWVQQHPTWGSVREIMEEATCPTWKTDVKRILEYLNRI